MGASRSAQVHVQLSFQGQAGRVPECRRALLQAQEQLFVQDLQDVGRVEGGGARLTLITRMGTWLSFARPSGRLRP